jgi:hypothetical protein
MVSLLSIATMKILRLPLPPRAFAFRSASGSSVALTFLATTSRKQSPQSWILLCRCDPLRLCPRRQEALPASLETPSPLCPALRPRADLHSRPLRRFGVAPVVPRTKAPPLYHFRDSITRIHGSLPTLEDAISDTSQGSLPECLVALPECLGRFRSAWHFLVDTFW